jgi:hypothetical protein
MAKLSDHLENALNEARMLLLGGQVLLGFTYRICFEPRFETMPRAVHIAEVAAIVVMTAGLGWLITPAPFDQIAARGRLTQRLHRFTTGVLDFALLPFCVGLGLSFYPVAVALHLPHDVLIAASVCMFSIFGWYGAGLLKRDSKHSRNAHLHLVDEENDPNNKEDLGERIKKVLIECRMALPGAQAFLGFQFAIVFTDSFEKLPWSSQLMHFATLVSTTVAIVLLIAPAAYHRLAESGEDSERFHTIASYLLIAALVFLAPGMAGDLYVVLAKFGAPRGLAIGVALGFVLMVYTLWFAYSLLKRRK